MHVPYLHHAPIPIRNIPPHLPVIFRKDNGKVNKGRSNNKDNENKPKDSKNNKERLKTTRGMHPPPPSHLHLPSPSSPHKNKSSS